MKPYSKSTLRFLLCLYRFSFARRMIKNAVKNHLTEIRSNIAKFKVSIIRLGYNRESSEYIQLSNLYATAVNFRGKKKLLKLVWDNLFVTPFLVFILTIPFCIPYFYFANSYGIFNYVLLYVYVFVASLLTVFILMGPLDFISNFEVRIGKALTKLLQLIFIIGFCSLIYFVFDLQEGQVKAVLLSVYVIVYAFIAITITEYLRRDILVDAYFYSKKIQITDALLIESAFRLSNVNWRDAVKKRHLRQEVIYEIERLAGLIEKDWSSHIISGDEKTNKWKTKTLIAIADGIRKLKRQVIIPAADTPTILEHRFKLIFEKILKHDLNGLIDAEVPMSRIRKKPKGAMLQSVLVSILPIALTGSLKLCVPDLATNPYVNIALVISGLWLLVCILLWLDPNLADKIATVKSMRSVVKGDE